MKRVGSKVYVHVSAVGDLTASQKRQLKAASRASKVYVWDVARLDTRSDEVMLGQTEPWEKVAHPCLMKSWLVRDGKVTRTDYRLRASKPIYHRKDSMVAKDHPSVRSSRP